jgi:putative membrane protein
MKMAAFALIGLLSVIPTIRIYHWWQQAKTGGFFLAPQAEVARVRLFLTIEAALFACVIGLAAAMAHGNAP